MKKTLFACALVTLLALSACAGQPGATVPDDAYVTTSCVAVSASRPANIQVDGIAVVNDYSSTSAPYLLNLADGSMQPLSKPAETIGELTVSPDQKTLAFQQSDPKTNTWNLVIADVHGNREKVIPWKQGFFNLNSWINNSQLLIATYPPLLVFNPFTGEQRGFAYTDLPDYLADSVSNRFAFFDPGLTSVLYKSQDDKNTLLDLASRRVLARVDNHPDPAPIAAWSPDGSRVAVVGTIPPPSVGPGTPAANYGHDIFSIGRDGQVKQLTNLTTHYGQLLTISPSGLSWSPDSRYLAFWIIFPAAASTGWQLAVYDTLSQKTTDYCISSLTTSFQPLRAPIWSPDGKQLMVENRYGQNLSHLVILDLERKAAFQAKDNVYPFGWLSSGNP